MSESKIDSASIKDKAGLFNYLAQGYQADYLFFWGHTAKNYSRVGKECLSQWYSAEFEIDSVTYPTAEHYMMAEKARLFRDDAMLNQILATQDPHEAKKLGRLVKGYDNELWNKQRFEIVVRGNSAKFSQNKELKEFLLASGSKIIVEASPRDRIWGIGMGQTNPDAMNPAKWRGMNLLGFALMVVREKL